VLLESIPVHPRRAGGPLRRRVLDAPLHLLGMIKVEVVPRAEASQGVDDEARAGFYIPPGDVEAAHESADERAVFGIVLGLGTEIALRLMAISSAPACAWVRCG